MDSGTKILGRAAHKKVFFCGPPRVHQEYVSPKMSARSELAGRKASWPHLGHFRHFPMDRNYSKTHIVAVFLGGAMVAI